MTGSKRQIPLGIPPADRDRRRRHASTAQAWYRGL